MAQPKKINTHEKIIIAGMKHMSKPYRLGAEPFQTKEFDCSSFVQYLYSQVDGILPRTSRQQSLIGKKIKKENIRRGDLLFFTSRARYSKKGTERIAHVAIFIGNDKMIHSCKMGGVVISKLSDVINKNDNKRWDDYYLFAKRISKDELQDLITKPQENANSTFKCLHNKTKILKCNKSGGT